MPLESINISNFQAHESTQIDFSETLSTIVGPSDVGKSAILRALRWLCLNTPQGDAFVRDGAQKAHCTLKVDGREITRTRSKTGENTYYLDGIEYKSFGNSVPAAIQQLLSVDQINFVGQHQSAYWFCESAGEVSRQLNAVVDLGIIDETLQNIGRKVREHQEEVRIGKDRLTTAREKKQALQWVEQAGEELVEVESSKSDWTKKNNRRCELSTLTGIVHETMERRDKSSALRDNAAVVGRCGVAARAVALRVAGLDRLIGEAQSSATIAARGRPDVTELTVARDRYLEKSRRAVILLESLDRAAVSSKKIKIGAPETSELAVAVGRLKSIAEKVSLLNVVLSDLRFIEKRVQAYREESIGAQSTLDRETEGRCPVCGKALEL